MIYFYADKLELISSSHSYVQQGLSPIKQQTTINHLKFNNTKKQESIPEEDFFSKTMKFVLSVKTRKSTKTLILFCTFGFNLYTEELYEINNQK